NATNETGYLVERAPDNAGVAGTYAQVASIAANSTSWTNAGLSPTTAYWYRVRAAGPANSDYSNVASATTPALPPPNAPSNLAALTISNTEIDLSWTENAPDETGATVQRAPDVTGAPGTYATVATVAATATIYKNTGLVANTTYWYRI